MFASDVIKIKLARIIVERILLHRFWPLKESKDLELSEGFKKLQDGPEFRNGHIGASRLEQSIGNSINGVLGEKGTQALGEVVKAIGNGYEENVPPQLKDVLKSGYNLAVDTNEFVSEKTNLSPIITGEAALALATGGSGKAVGLVKQGSRQSLRAIKKAEIPSRIYEAQRDLRGMGAVPLGTPGSVGAASTLPTPSNWQNRARDLFENQEHKKLADFFRKGQGGKLKQKNLFITADELALNKDGVLDQQLERADRMAALRTKWDKQGKEIKGDRQREYYDAASLNANISDIEMYSSDPARKYITKFTNILSKDQWHHVFGNKEAGEFILSICHSDPLVAANLFKKMESLGLNSSGIASNIAILKEAKHTNWHNYIKDMGFEPKSPGKALTTKGSTAPGDFADICQELGRAIVSGKADINDAFELIERYAKYNEWMKTQITSKKYEGKIIANLPEGVGKAIQMGGYRTRPPKSTYNPVSIH